MLLRYPRASL